MKVAQYLHWKVCLTVLVIAGCASLGLEPAKSFEQRLAYAYAQVASIRTAAANALNTGAIKVEDAKQVQLLADQARAGLDAARAAQSAGDTKTALGRLELANAVLTQLATYLQKAKA